MSDPKYIENYILEADVDYLIGSVHFLQKWGFDNPEFIATYEEKDIDMIWQEYFATVSAMVKSGYFNIVAHLDLIKVFKFMPKKNIKDIVYQTMLDIKKSNMAIEINSAGLRKPIKEQYPSKDILQLAFDLDIPITFGSDAHSLDQIGFGYDKVVLLAKQIGYTKCVVFKNKIAQSVTF